MRSGADGPEDWNPEKWLLDLQQRLQLAGVEYVRVLGQADEEVEVLAWPAIRPNRSSFALLALGTVTDALKKLPGMDQHAGLVPLHDLTAALLDLGMGGQPALLKPVRGVGKGGELTGRRWVRQHALLYVALLESIGDDAGSACETVAAALATNGHVGKKKGQGPKPLSKATVEYWRNQSRQADFARRDPRMAAFLVRHLDRHKESPGWPLPRQKIIELIRDMASSPLMRSKID